MISKNHSGFFYGGHITENIMLAQEIVYDTCKPNQEENIMIKLDMDKAYDWLSWTFLFDLLNKFGFSSNWIEIIIGDVSDILYSIIINGTRHGFSSSS